MTRREKILPLLGKNTQETVYFRPVMDDEDIWYATEGCRLTPEQQELVNSGGFSLGRAYLHPDNNVPCIICNQQDMPVGFIMLTKWLGAGEASSWSYFIDVNQQGRGYGRAAAGLAVSILKQAFPEIPIKLSTEAVNEKAQALYLSLGFQKLDELDGDDLVFMLSL